MEYVYMLLHKRKIADVDLVYETKLIGFYSSKENAATTIEHYKNLEGFKDFPEDFIIKEREVDEEDIEFS